MESYQPGEEAPSTENSINDFQNLGNIWKLSFDVLQGDNFANSNQVHPNFDLPTDYDPRLRPPYRYRQCEDVNTTGGKSSFSNRLNFYGGVVERNYSHTVVDQGHPYGRLIQPASDQHRVRLWSCPQSERHENLARPVPIYPEVNNHYWNYDAGQSRTYSSYSESLSRGEVQQSNAHYFQHFNEQHNSSYVLENDPGQPHHYGYDQSVPVFPVSTEHDPREYVAEPNSYYQFQPVTQESSQESYQNSFQWQEVPKKRKPRYYYQHLESTHPTPSTSSAPSTSTSISPEQSNGNTTNFYSSFTVSLPGGKPLFTIPLVGASTSATSASVGERPPMKKKKSRTVVYRSESYMMEKLRKPRVAFPVSSIDIPYSNMEESIPSPEMFNYNLDSDLEAEAGPSTKKREPRRVVQTKKTYKMCEICKKPKWRNKISRACGRCKCKDKSQVAPDPKVPEENRIKATPTRSSRSRNRRSDGEHNNHPLPRSRSSSIEIVYSSNGPRNRQIFGRGPNTTVKMVAGNEICQGMGIDPPVSEMALPDPQQSILDMPDIFQLFESTDQSAKGDSSGSSIDGGSIAKAPNESSENINSGEEKGLANQETSHSSEVASSPVSQSTPIVSSSSSDDDDVADYLPLQRANENKGRSPSDETCQNNPTVTRSLEVIADGNNSQRIPSPCFSNISEDNDNKAVNDELGYILSEGEILSDDETSEAGNNFGESEHFPQRDEVVTTTTAEVYPFSGNVCFGTINGDNEDLPQRTTTFGLYGGEENRNMTISSNDNNIYINGLGMYVPFPSFSVRLRPQFQFKVTSNGAPVLMTGIFNRGPYDSEVTPLEENQNRYSNMNICITPAHQQDTSNLRDLYQNTSHRGQSNTGPFAHLHQLSNISTMPPSINHNPFDNKPEGPPWQLQIQEFNTIQNKQVIEVVGQGVSAISNQLDFNRIGDVNGKSQSEEINPVRKMPNTLVSPLRSVPRNESRLQSKGRICKFDEEGVKTVTRIAHKILSQTKATGKYQNRKSPPAEPGNKTALTKRVTSKSLKAKPGVVPSARLGRMLKKFATAVGRKQKVSRIQERLMEDVQKVYKLGSTSESGSDKSQASLNLQEVSLSIPGPFERRLRSRQEKQPVLQVIQAGQNNTQDQVEQENSRICEPTINNPAAGMISNVLTSTNEEDKMEVAQSDNDIPMQGHRTPSSDDDDDILSLHADASLDDDIL